MTAANSNYINPSLGLQHSQLGSKQSIENFHKQINGRSISPSITEDKLKEISNKTSMLYEEFQEQLHQNPEDISSNIRAGESLESETITENILPEVTNFAQQTLLMVKDLGFVCKNEDEFVRNFERAAFQHVKSLDRIKEDGKIPEEELKQIEQKQNEFIDQLVDEGQIYKEGPNGEIIPLTAADKDLLKQEFKKVFKEYIANYSSTLQAKKQESTQNQTEEEAESKTHLAVVFDTRHPQPIIEVKIPNILVVELLARSIIQNIIKNIAIKSEQARAEERKEQILLDLIDRIKQDVIKKEILTREIVKSDIKLQELKDRINKYIEAPVEDLIRISEAYSKVKGKTVTGGKVRLQLPGIHKMKPLSAA